MRFFPFKLRRKASIASVRAQLNLLAETFANIALSTAFVAVERGMAVVVEYLVQAAKLEAQKIDRPFSATETGGWI
jgi:hypothetical protein